MTHRDPDFEAALQANPADQGLRLVYADAVEEAGDFEYARALRWLAANGRWPVPSSLDDGVGGDGRVGQMTVYAFTHDKNDNIKSGNLYEARSLPVPMFQRMYSAVRLDNPDANSWQLLHRLGSCTASAEDYWCCFATVQLATEYLARALADVCPLCNGSGFPGTTERNCPECVT